MKSNGSSIIAMLLMVSLLIGCVQSPSSSSTPAWESTISGLERQVEELEAQATQAALDAQATQSAITNELAQAQENVRAQATTAAMTAQAATTCGGDQDVTQQGEIIATVTEPFGAGNQNIEVIRDDVRPPAGNHDSMQQYDTYDDNGPDGENGYSEYYGYTFDVEITFTKVVYLEGDHWDDGGWWADGSLRIQIRQGGQWVDVTAIVEPPYPTGDTERDFEPSYETYTFILDNIRGDGIRLYGTSGGSSHFVSIGELTVCGIP